jgi:hypothetical protein
VVRLEDEGVVGGGGAPLFILGPFARGEAADYFTLGCLDDC